MFGALFAAISKRQRGVNVKDGRSKASVGVLQTLLSLLLRPRIQPAKRKKKKKRKKKRG